MSAIADTNKALTDRRALLPLLDAPGWALFRSVFETQQAALLATILSETTEPAERENLVVRYNARADLFGTPAEMIKGADSVISQDPRYQEEEG